MLFKDIESFEDLMKCEKREVSHLVAKKLTSIKQFKTISLSELEYATKLSEIVYFLIKIVQDRNQEDFDRCFKNTLEYLEANNIHLIHDFSYIIKMLLLFSKSFRFDLKEYIQEYIKIIYTEKKSINLRWLIAPLINSKNCDNDLIEYVLLKLEMRHEAKILELLKKNCNSMDMQKLNLNYAKKLEKLASEEESLKAIYFYELAIDIYLKFNKVADIERIKPIKNKISYDLDTYEISFSDEIVKVFEEYTESLKQEIDKELLQDNREKAFNILFSNIFLPKKEENISNTIRTPFRSLGNITSIGDGTKITFSSEEDKKRYLQFENYRLSLDIQMNIFTELLKYSSHQKLNIYAIINDIYIQSEIFDIERESLILDLIKRHKNRDIIGFNYIFNPTFEYLLKEICKLNNISPYKTEREEDKTLGKLLKNNKDILEKIYGKDFYYLLDNLFSYEFGLNIRNSLLHGNGMSFLNQKYFDILFYVFIVLITYVRKIEDV
jgi:hypothetical protein